MPAARFIALLRGINVAGRNRIPMDELRALCGRIGWQDVRSYIQSGNLVFGAAGRTTALEADLEQAIARRFGLTIAVVVRAAAGWPAYVAGNPFPGPCKTEPNRVLLALSKAPPKKDAVLELRKWATSGERIEQVGDALWVHFANGIGRSKLSPAVLDRLVGSPVTARNWRTVLELQTMTQ